MHVNEAKVILHLRITLQPGREAEFDAYVREAFPVFEADGGCRGAVYAIEGRPLSFDEVFYYASEAAYQAGERAIQEDPVQVALLARWRAMLAGPPEVEVVRRWDAP